MHAQHSQPAPFTTSGGNGLGLTFSTCNQGGCSLDSLGDSFEDMKNNFGLLLGKPKNGICLDNVQTKEELMCGMDLLGAYKAREWPIFNTLVTAQLLNARNRFLPSLISPIFETPEVNFTMQHTTISSMPFTKIAECGIPEEPSGSYTYAWKQSVSRYAQGCTFSRDLMTDENFGAEAWLSMLSAFIGNARLTIDMGIITTAFQMGYENMRRARTEGCPVDKHKQWLAESAGFFSMAINPELTMTIISNLKGEMNMTPDTIIMPSGTSRYIRDMQGNSETMLVQRISTDPNSQRIVMEFVEGPDNYKTIRLGSQPTNVIEFEPFYVGDIGMDQKDCARVNPFTTNVTIGQYYPTNPLIKIDETPKVASADIHVIRIFKQTKTIGQFEDITLADRLRNSIYYDKKTGKVSQQAHDFARSQTQRRGNSPQNVPWDWNVQNPEYRHDADINKETTSNSEPNMALVNGLTNLREMTSWREEFVGVGYDPKNGRFYIPKRFGDFPLRSIPNDYVRMAARYLEAKYNEEYPTMPLEESFVQARKLFSALRTAPWSDNYLFALLNKNVPKMIVVSGTVDAPVYRLVPVRTPLVRLEKRTSSSKNPQDQCKFPDAAVIEEVKTNRFGGWDLPDRTGDMLNNYPAGFHNGVGVQVLAQEALKQGTSLWYDVGVEAQTTVMFAERLVKFTERYVGKPDTINGRLLPPWIHVASSKTMVLDTMARSSGPVHVGVPSTINYVDNGPVTGVATQKVNLTSNAEILLPTVAETRAALEETVRTNGARSKVNNETRALACLSEEVYAKMRGIDGVIEGLGGDDAFKSEVFAALHKLYDYAIASCSNIKSAAQHKTNVENISIVMNSFHEQLQEGVRALADELTLPTTESRDAYRRDTIVRNLRAFVANFKSVSGMKRLLGDERKRLGPICLDYGEGFVDALRRYEEEPISGRPVTVSQGTGAFTATTAPVYRADYTAPPAKFLRAPLASSQALRDYLRDKTSPWILPSDYNLFYAYPEEPRIVTGNETVDVSVHKQKYDLCSLARSHIFQCRLNSKKPAVSSSAMDVEGDNDFFSSLKSKKKTMPKATKKKGSLSMAKILGMGRNYRDEDEEDELNDEESDDPYYRDSVIRERSRAQQGDPTTGLVELNNRMADEYKGPWGPRLAYKNNEISSLGVGFFFDAIIQSRNRLETPVKLSAAGAVILDAFLIRPFIEVRTSAILVMKAGADTMLTTIGHSHVQVTKQSRGCWHIDVGFLMGILKMNPNNVIVIPHAVPVSLLGGKNTNFMTNFADLRLPNPAKPSMISVLVGPDEGRQLEAPIHIANGETTIRQGIDFAIHERKHSSGSWLEFLFGAQTIANIDQSTANRETYSSCVPAANVLSQGPASYVDPRTGRWVDIEGNGPMGTFNMNMPGVQEVYEGRAQRFPDRIQMQAYQNL